MLYIEIFKMEDKIFYIGKFRWKNEIYNGKHEPILSIEEYAAFKKS